MAPRALALLALAALPRAAALQAALQAGGAAPASGAALDGAAGGAGPLAQNGTLRSWLDGLLHSAQVRSDPGVQKMFALVPGLEGALQGPDALQQAFSPRMIDALQRGFDGSLPATTSRDAKGRERVDLGDGLVITRLAPGANGSSPVDDDSVSLEYRAFTRDGDEYASSRSLGPLNFTLGDPGLIPGLARAVRHMTLGERVLVRLPRQLLYPIPPEEPLPPDDVLIFDVTLRHVGSVEAPEAPAAAPAAASEAGGLATAGGAGPLAQNGTLRGWLDGLLHSAQVRGDPGVQKMLGVPLREVGSVQTPPAGGAQ